MVLDDSLVRGTTLTHLIRMLRQAGAREVHMRITCPPIRHPCFMGVDMATYDELIAHRSSIGEIASQLEVDSLHFLSLEGMMDAIGSTTGYCNACFTGNYPFRLDPLLTKTGFESTAGEL